MPAAFSSDPVVAAKFAKIIESGSSYQMVARLEVRDPLGTTILDSASSTILNVTGGSIQVDGNASFTRSLQNLQVIDPTNTLVPKSKADYFSPASNNELLVSVGALIDGTPAYVLQGVFHLEGAVVEDTAEGLSITLSAYDRARKYSRSKRITPRRFLASGDPTWPGGWPITEAIAALLRDAFVGTVVYTSGSPTALLPEQDVLQGTDPWETAREWADSMGYILFFDRAGDCRLQPVPNPNDPALGVNWTYAEGQGGLLGTVRRQSNDGVFNGCAVRGVNPSNGSAVKSDMIWDSDPNSATYFEGPYGKVPQFLESDKVRDVAQANAMATAKVNENKGLVEGVEFTIVPNPAIDPLDTIKLTRVRAGFPATGIGSEAVLVDRYTVNLSATGGAMTVQCRQRRLS